MNYPVFSGTASGTIFGYTFSQMVYDAVLCNFINTVAATNAHYKLETGHEAVSQRGGLKAF
jgi:hypothetical protein